MANWQIFHLTSNGNNQFTFFFWGQLAIAISFVVLKCPRFCVGLQGWGSFPSRVLLGRRVVLQFSRVAHEGRELAGSFPLPFLMRFCIHDVIEKGPLLRRNKTFESTRKMKRRAVAIVNSNSN